uniref:RING-type domain-containing protein n=1 Tax=Heterorhabditis bacteriophora TaxID=37862 RepID=A0A1I7WY03_HETBA
MLNDNSRYHFISYIYLVRLHNLFISKDYKININYVNFFTIRKQMNQSKEVSKVNSSVDDIGKSTQEFSQLTSNSISPIPMVDLHACGICFQLYDETVRVPKILFCGHTYCLSCMNSLVHHNGPFPMCPVCRKITRQRVEKLPNNFQLLREFKNVANEELNYNSNFHNNGDVYLKMHSTITVLRESTFLEILSRFELLSTENSSHLKEPRERDTTDHQQSSIEEILNQIDNEMDIIFSVIETQLDAMRIVDSPAFETNTRFLNLSVILIFLFNLKYFQHRGIHNRYLHRDMRNPTDVISNLARDSNLIAEFLEQDGLSNDIVSQHGVAATSGSNDMVHYRSIFDDESGEMLHEPTESQKLRTFQNIM